MPDDEWTPSADAASLANQIEALDAEIEQRTKRFLGLGMMSGRFSAHKAEDQLDDKRDALLPERAELVERSKALAGVG